ncbi:hypothetical protein Syun_012451 [Stephania yunnanensis]|uniref:Uncharacterized protein n=1 Tax=Stephania yunnanensis TaxID=152371 RepID=A0AAP0PJH5_9MAGN
MGRWWMCSVRKMWRGFGVSERLGAAVVEADGDFMVGAAMGTRFVLASRKRGSWLVGMRSYLEATSQQWNKTRYIEPFPNIVMIGYHSLIELRFFRDISIIADRAKVEEQ